MNLVEVFPWNKNLETGIVEIDEQHKGLVALLNKLAYHVAFQSDKITLDHVFNELSEYAVYHFRTEEYIWNQTMFGDEWERDHKRSHKRFFMEIQLIKKGKESREPFNKIIEEIISFLAYWLAFHILDEDKRMARVLQFRRDGITISDAKILASKELSGSIKVMIESILLMYDTLTVRTLQLMKEIIERHKAEAKLRLSADAVKHTLEAICITDANSIVIEVNPAFYETTGYMQSDVIGKNIKEIKSGLREKELASEIWIALTENGHWSGEVWSRKKNGEIDAEWLTLSIIKDDQGLISNYVGIFSNISSLIQQRSKLELSANYDLLTGLPNRLLLSDRLDMAISNANRSKLSLAVCYLDLDGFKEVNDRLGHAAGDHLLKEIAQRFLRVKRGNDSVVRIGGDEFVILIGDLKNPADCTHLLDLFLQEVEQPLLFNGEVIKVTASIGIAMYPQNDCDRDTLLQRSDEAMYQAKKSGKSRYHYFDPVAHSGA